MVAPTNLPSISAVIAEFRRAHREPARASSGVLGLLLALHHNNVVQWTREDAARRDDADDRAVATAKRDIDLDAFCIVEFVRGSRVEKDPPVNRPVNPPGSGRPSSGANLRIVPNGPPGKKDPFGKGPKGPPDGPGPGGKGFPKGPPEGVSPSEPPSREPCSSPSVAAPTCSRRIPTRESARSGPTGARDCLPASA